MNEHSASNHVAGKRSPEIRSQHRAQIIAYVTETHCAGNQVSNCVLRLWGGAQHFKINTHAAFCDF